MLLKINELKLLLRSREQLLNNKLSLLKINEKQQSKVEPAQTTLTGKIWSCHQINFYNWNVLRCSAMFAHMEQLAHFSLAAGQIQ